MICAANLRFAAGKREAILENWKQDYGRLKVNIRFDAGVQKISGKHGDFLLETVNRETISAETLVLAIGLEGNPRKIGVPGEQLSGIQYQLDDPEEFKDETILVVGAGDAAIENALALSEQNDVWIINRGKEFARAKDKNLSDVLAAINNANSRLDCLYETRIKQIQPREGLSPPMSAVLDTAAGEKTIECHRIIARLGAEPPRKFVESVGIRFPNNRSDAIPELTSSYESNVRGIYIIGSLAGYPLINRP